MAASASDTTTVQYPIWIDDDKIYCDEAKLKDHLTDKLNYNGNDAAKITEQINENIEDGLLYFWRPAAMFMSTEAITALLHSIEHNQLLYLLSYQNWDGYTALHCCAVNKRKQVIKVILDSVGEQECYQLLSIKEMWRMTPLHESCVRGDTESVRLILNHVNQDMRYSLLQMTTDYGTTPLHSAPPNDPTDLMKVIHESVTQSQWINLLQMKGCSAQTALQDAVYWNEQSSIDTIRDSVNDEEWIQLLSTPLPEYNQWHKDNDRYQRAVDRTDELRAAARVKGVLQT